MGVLRTYKLSDAVDFILYLLEQQQDDLLWDIWLHRKPSTGEGKQTRYLDFGEYKKLTKTPSLRNKQSKALTADEEKQRLEFASQFIKTRKEPTDGSI